MRSLLPAPLLCLLVLLAAALAPAQTTRNVGSGQPYTTIQSAIDAANPGDTVLIAPGTYFENIDFHGKAITVTSSGGPAVTILDGSQTAPAVTFSSGETRASILSNLTIQHGGHFGGAGIAVGALVLYNSAPTIRNNLLRENNCWTIYANASAPLIQSNEISATQDPQGQCSFGGGAAIYLGSNLNYSTAINDGNSPVVTGNIIENNVESGIEDAGGNGGALAVWGGSPIIMNNVIRDNASPGGSGGGINVEYGYGVAIVQNLIYNNSANCGGGALAIQGNPDPRTGITALVANNTITNDTGHGPGGYSECFNISEIYPSPDTYGASSPATIFLNNVVSASTSYQAAYCGSYNLPGVPFQADYANNILYNSSGPFFNSICVDVTALDGNIPADPQFLNPATFDLHLQSTSPAIGHGDPSVLATFHTLTGLTLSTDFDGNPRETASGSTCAIDMGAYQHTGTATACGAQLTLAATPNPSTIGQTVTFTAQLAATNTPPTGDIQFTDSATVLATVTISSSGLTTFATSQLAVGTHTITATYQPIGNTPGSQATVTQVVNPFATTTTLTSSLNPASFGQSITLSAAVTSPSGNPTGTITFTDGAVTLATIPAPAGTATFTTSTLAAGSHPITATFAPSGSFAGSSATLTQVILGEPTTTSLAVTPNPSAAFATLTLTTAVTSTAGTPTGAITFTANGTTLGRATLGPAAQATLTIAAPPPGTYTVLATYSGDTTFQGSTSAAVLETVIAAPSTTQLTSTPNPAYQGQTVSLSATVAGMPGQIPTGNVTFYDGTTPLGTALLSATGVAQLSTNALAPGTHALSATFPGAGAYTGSSSAPLQQVILPSTFAIALSPATLTLSAGHQGTVQILLTSVGAFSGPLQLSVSAMPTYANGTLSAQTVNLTAGTGSSANLLITTSVSPLQSARLPSSARPGAVLAGLVLLVLPFRRRLRPYLHGGLLLLLLAVTLGTASGCGADIIIPFHTVAPGTYRIPVTATDPNHNTQTATLTLTITP